MNMNGKDIFTDAPTSNYMQLLPLVRVIRRKAFNFYFIYICIVCLFYNVHVLLFYFLIRKCIAIPLYLAAILEKAEIFHDQFLTCTIQSSYWPYQLAEKWKHNFNYISNATMQFICFCRNLQPLFYSECFFQLSAHEGTWTLRSLGQPIYHRMDARGKEVIKSTIPL